MADSEFRQGMCPKHGEFQQRVTKVLDREFLTSCQRCVEEAEKARASHEAAEHEKKRAAALEKALTASGIVPRFHGKLLSTWSAETGEKKNALEAVCKMRDDIIAGQKTASLMLCGRPGTGKSHLASGLVIELVMAHKVVRKINAADMVRAIRETWSKGSEMSESDAYHRLAWKDLLVIDEIGAQAGSDNEKLILFEVINSRYENMLPTVIISNLAPDDLLKELGDRVADRLREDGGRMIPFNWQSARRNA